MFLTEFFGKSLDIKSPTDRDHDDQEIANELFQYILEHDRLHKEYFHPLAKKISRQQQNKKENKSRLVKEFMPMVEKGCKEYYHKNKLTGKLGKLFPLDMREELCDRLYDHYCDDIKRDKYKLMEGGNLSSHDSKGQPTKGWKGIPGHFSAGKIDSKNRAVMQPVVKKLLVDINNLFTRQYGRPIWSAELIDKEVHEFISGSSKWFMMLRQPNPRFDPQQPESDANPKEIGVTDNEFQRVKKKVGDIDTQIDRRLEPQIEEMLHNNIGADIGSATLLGIKKGSDQWLALWQIHEPPITLQVDLEFSDYTTDDRGFEVPTEWAQVSHGSTWEDLEEGMKGVFRQWLYRSLAKIAPTEKYIAKMKGAGKNRKMKLFGGEEGDEEITDIENPPPPLHDANFSFAVASVGGGGIRAKYRQPTPQENVPLEINGVPVMFELNSKESEYIKDMGPQFEQFFGRPATGNETKMMASFVGSVELMKQYFTPEQQEIAVKEFLKINFGKGAQMIDADDPTSDFKTKMVAIDYLLDHTGLKSMRKQVLQMAEEYENSFNAKKETTALAEAEDKPQPAVKAQLRKGMPHLRDLKPADFLDLIDELQDSGGRFVLQNIPLNVKIDGFGGRFGKDAEGKPFMGTSRTEPKYKAGFLDYHKQKGTTDPEVLGRAANFDKLFTEMMTAIKMVDSALGPDFLVDRQVTCEVLFLPFATKTESGGLKFVGIEYDQIPKGVDLVLVPFRIVEGGTGEEIADGDAAVQQIAELGQSDNVMFMSNRLVQKQGLDVTEIVNVLDNIDELKDIVSGTAGKRDRASADLRRQVEEKLKPVQIALEKAIDEDPNIVGKDKLGSEYEGIVINSRLGPIKVTSQTQKDLIANKNAARAAARTDRGRDNANKTAVVAIGSFIGHRGHQELWNYTIDKAKKLNGDPYLFIGNAEGKDDPIPPSVKVETWHKLYPRYARNISTVNHEGGSLIQKIKHELINPLPGKPPRYDNVVIMVGEDRVNLNMPQALMKAVNKFPGYEHVKVSLDVTPRGQGVSGTALRNAIKTKTPEEAFEEWNQAFNGGDFGAQQLPPDWIEHLMDISAKGMGITPKAAEPAKVAQPEKTKEPVAERILTALINHKTSVVEDEEHQLRQRLIRAIARATGYGVAELNLLSTAELKELVAEKSHHKHQDTEESFWKPPSPAQVRLNRALERERKKSEPDRAQFQRELDRIMPPPKKEPEDKGVEENRLNEASSDEAWELVGQPVPEIQKFVKQMGYGNNEESVEKITTIIDKVESTQIPTSSISKLKNLANKGNDAQTLKAVQKISGQPNAEQQYTKLMKARDAEEGRERDISGYIQYVKSGNYDPPVLLELPSGLYVIGGRTRLYAALALGVPANVKILRANDFKQNVAEGFKHPKTYLWHGSREKISVLEPRQAADTGGAEGSNQTAIYATADPKVAIAMALTTKGSDTGMFLPDTQIILFKGKIRKGESVYLHKLPMNGPDGKPQFVPGGNGKEFYSAPGVTEIRPVEIKEVPVNRYLNLIRNATPEDWELRKKHMKQGVAEGSENNNITAQKIFFARSNKTPKGWSYDHVGFITQDGRQIQMSGHKGNDVYVTNDVNDDPEFPEQNIKIVSLSKPVSVPTTNSVGAENCGTFVANVLQANGIKGIDTQKIYSVFKQPPKQGVAESTLNKFDHARHVPVGASVENIMASLINRIIVNEAIQNRQQ
jgi:hypothetical protein